MKMELVIMIASLVSTVITGMACVCPVNNDWQLNSAEWNRVLSFYLFINECVSWANAELAHQFVSLCVVNRPQANVRAGGVLLCPCFFCYV